MSASAAVTYCTCFYIVSSKFPPEQYVQWMQHFFSMVREFYLVVYTDEHTLTYMKTRLTIDIQHHPRIRIILKPLETLYYYQYKDFWIKNAEKNVVYLPNSSWELMMIWCEKIAFVKECIDRQYFDTPYYGWCDIGYFRNRAGLDTPVVDLTHWSHPHAIHSFMGKSDPLGSQKKIIYANVCPYGDEYMRTLMEQIRTSDDIPPIPPTQISIAGGFFLLDPSNIGWWFDTFDQRLRQYIQYDRLIKDDQILLADCIYHHHPDRFYLCEEKKTSYDNWFMFQRILNYVPFTARIGISILMPLYNGVEFLPESVASVLAQTYQRWELIIGVNGHPAGSHVYRTARAYEDKKIKVVDLPITIVGKSAALNEMVKYCQYEYVALLDVDDIWHERKLEVQLPKIADQYDVVGSHCIYFGDRQGEPALPVQDLSQFDFTQCNPIINSSCVLKKEWAYWNPLWEGIEDYELWLRLRKQGKTFYNCPERLVKHRIHANSAFNARGNHKKVAKLLQTVHPDHNHSTISS